jgi:hypothetical protein
VSGMAMLRLWSEVWSMRGMMKRGGGEQID